MVGGRAASGTIEPSARPENGTIDVELNKTPVGKRQTAMCDDDHSCAGTEPLVLPVRRFARPPAGLRFRLRTLLIGIVVNPNYV